MLTSLSHDLERDLSGDLALTFEEAQSFVTTLLKRGHSVSSDPIVRTLNLEGIETVRQLAIPGEPQAVSSVVQEALAIFGNRMRLEHPNCFGYIPSCPSPFAYLGDFLTSIFNVNTAIWNISSGPSVVENALVRWLADQVGLPPSAGGCFVSGGSMANMTSIILARDKMIPQGRQSDAVIYMSEQTHVSVAKSLHITGFRKNQIRIIPTDNKFRVDPEAIRQAIITDRRSGCLPFLIVASCGTTNTGSIDPLHALADIAQDEGMWLHVDGAYGASIALSSTHRHLLDGLGRADSISWDGHKWLFQTYGCGIVLVRDAKALEDSLKVDADYIRTSSTPDGTTNSYNISPELSRPSRAMPLWFTLRILGHHRIGEMIDHGFNVALAAENAVRQLTNWEIVSPATASIVVFRYTPPGLDDQQLDSLNSAISARLLAENAAVILTTKLRGQTVLRLCAINPETRLETITQIIQRIGLVAEEELGLNFHKMEPHEKETQVVQVPSYSKVCASAKI